MEVMLWARSQGCPWDALTRWRVTDPDLLEALGSRYGFDPDAADNLNNLFESEPEGSEQLEPAPQPATVTGIDTTSREETVG
jgi:hypothetical protein